jgi:hypothetical protein
MGPIGTDAAGVGPFYLPIPAPGVGPFSSPITTPGWQKPIQATANALRR